MKLKFAFTLIFCFFSSLISAEELGDLSASQLITMQNQQKALVIDIRTEKEWQSTGTIPGSKKLQFFSATGKFDTDKWLADLNQLKSSIDQPIILVCRSGNRSGRVGKLLTEQIKLKNIFHLSNGMSSWVKSGNNVVKEALVKSN